MTEELLTAVAIAFELGIAASLIFIVIRKPALRKLAISPLGAITPLLASYLFLSISYLVDPGNTKWAFQAVWIMSFFVYVLLLIVGLLLAFWSRPHNWVARYFLAALIAPFSAFALFAAQRYAA